MTYQEFLNSLKKSGSKIKVLLPGIQNFLEVTITDVEGDSVRLEDDKKQHYIMHYTAFVIVQA